MISLFEQMGRTKQTPRGSASHQPVGMMAATFTSMGRGKAGPEEQFIDTLEEDTEEDFPLVLEDAEKQPKEGKPGASKSKGKKLAQAAEGAEAPPEETPPDPKPTKPHTDPALQNPSQAQARLPPRTPPRPPPMKLPSLLPETQTKMNPQLPPSMSRSTKQQAKIG